MSDSGAGVEKVQDESRPFSCNTRKEVLKTQKDEGISKGQRSQPETTPNDQS